MGKHEAKGLSDEWYTPKYIFDAMGVGFDVDVAHPRQTTHVPAQKFIYEDSLTQEWQGFIWMNPPWCNTKEKIRWVNKFIVHGNGVALMPDSTSTTWWQHLAGNVDAILFTNGRVKFIKPDGTTGNNPANGTALFAIGEKGVLALQRAEKNGLGICLLTAKN